MEEQKDGAAEKHQVNYRGWKAMPYVIGNETFEKLGTLGALANLLVYLTNIFHMKSVTAAVFVSVFGGTTSLTPLLGAFLSDTFLGRFATLAYASVSSLLGMTLLALTAAISRLHPRSCSGGGGACEGPDSGQLLVLFASFAFLVVGAGGIRPCNLAFGADQFDPGTEAGKKGINSFFNWYYFTFTISMMIASTFIIYVQSSISWALGLAIPAALMLLSCVFFFVGSPIYVKVRPEGSPITSIIQVLVAACRKRALALPTDNLKESLFDPPHLSSLISKLSHTDQFRFLDKAAFLTPMDEVKPNGLPADAWRLCTLQQVEQVKCLARIVPVWSSLVIFSISSFQLGTYVVFQALQSDRRFGRSSFQIPAATFTVFTMAAITIWLPIYDRIVVPWFQKLTGKEGGITLLQRIGTGLVIAIVAMILAGFVEERRRSCALRKPPLGYTSGGDAIADFSSFWLTPQLLLIGLADAFSIIGQVEFYYKQFPENMRSVAGGLLFLGFACSQYLGSLLISIVHRTTGGRRKNNWLAGDLNHGRLDLYYYLIAAMSVCNFAFFVVCSKWYRYKNPEKNHLEMALQEKEIKNTV